MEFWDERLITVAFLLVRDGLNILDTSDLQEFFTNNSLEFIQNGVKTENIQ